MTTVNVYLTFADNCEEAFNFYQSIFGREFSSFQSLQRDASTGRDAPAHRRTRRARHACFITYQQRNGTHGK